MTDGVESMFDFICVSRIGLHGMVILCVVLCVVLAVSFCNIPTTSMYGSSYRRGNIEVCDIWGQNSLTHIVSGRRLYISPSRGVVPTLLADYPCSTSNSTCKVVSKKVEEIICLAHFFPL